MNPTKPDTAEAATAAPEAPSVQSVSDLEARWPSVNLEEQRRLYARIEVVRAKLLNSRPAPVEDLPPF